MVSADRTLGLRSERARGSEPVEDVDDDIWMAVSSCPYVLVYSCRAAISAKI